MLKNNWVRLLLVFFAFSFAFRTDFSFDQDLGRHIKLGEIVIKTGEVPKTNLFSYTAPDFEYVNSHWLFGVIAYFFDSLGLIGVFFVLKLVIYLISIYLILRLIPLNLNSTLLVLGFFTFHVMRERVELRPEIFSFFFTALSLNLLSSYYNSAKKTDKKLFILPFVQLLWVNIHIYFFVGFLLQGIFFLALVFDFWKKRLTLGKIRFSLVILISSAILSLINPNAINGLTYPLNVTRNYGYNIVENQSIFFLENLQFTDRNFIFVKITWAVFLMSLIWALIKKRLTVIGSLLIFTSIILSFMHVRSFPYLIFLGLPAVVSNFGKMHKSKLIQAIPVLVAAMLILESVLYLSNQYYQNNEEGKRAGIVYEQSAKRAMEFVKTNKLPNPIFNNFDIGSYIIYQGYPEYKVFVDGRPEAYPAEFFINIYTPIQYDYSKFKIAEAGYGFKTIIFSHTDQTPWALNFLQNIIKDESWSTVYLDNFIIILTKSDIARSQDLPRVDLNQLQASNFNFDSYFKYLRLGYFLLRINAITSAESILNKSFELNPNSPYLNKLIYNKDSHRYFW